MTLRLGVRLELDKGNLAAGAREAARAVDDIGEAARRAETASEGLGAGLARVAPAATTGARATVAAAGAQAAAFQSATRATQAHGTAMKLTGAQAQQLTYQLNDVVVSLAGGINPLMVMMQQGSQITPIFGGAANTLRAFGSLFNPITIGASGLAIAVGLVAKATWDYQAATRASAVAAAGLGRNLGTSAGAIERIATTSADAGEVSVAAAREMAQEFTRTGKIGVSNFNGLIGITKDFAATLGTDVPAATKMLAEIMADPAKGAVTLSQSLGLVDGATQRVVQRLVEQNRTFEAQATLINALKGNLVKAGEATTSIGRAWDDATRAMSNYYTAVGRAVSIDVIGRGDDLEAARQKVDALERLAKKATAGSTVQQDAERELATERAKLATLQAQEAARRGLAAAADRDRTISRGVSIAEASQSPSAELARRRKQLSDEIDALEKARAAAAQRFGDETRGTPKLTQAMEASTFDATRIEEKKRALSTLISESERARQLDEVDLALMTARDPIERAMLERKRVLISLQGQEVTAAEASAAAERAYARALGEAVAQASVRIADLGAEVAARRRVADMVATGKLAAADADRELQIELETRQLVAAAARAEGAEKERLIALAAGLRTAYEQLGEQQKRASALQSLASGRDRIETARAELALVGQSEATRARVLKLLEAEQEIRRLGLATASAEAQAIRANAEAEAALSTQLERQRGAWDEVKQTGSAIDTLTEGLRTGKDVSKQLVDDLTKEAMKLGVANPLKNAIFGQNLPEIGDVAKLFGGRGSAAAPALLPQSIASATINAGTVMVNGSIAGAGVGTVSGGVLAPIGANDNGALAATRRAFAGDLADPAMRSRLLAMTEAEVGGQGPAAQQAFMESVMNRASARGMSLGEVLGDRAYFPGSTFSAADRALAGPGLDAKYAEMLKRVQGGSNLSNFATGNASGSVGFAGGPMTFAAGGERFGIEGPDLSWARRLQETSTQASRSIGEAGQTLATSTTNLATGTESAFSSLLGGLGSGIDGLLSGLSNLVSKSGGGGLFGGLFSGLFGSTSGAGLATPTLGGLYATGGFTGMGGKHEPAGIVHRGEYVFDAASTAAIGVGNLEAMRHASRRGYASGGYVGSVPAIAAAEVKRIASAAVAGDGSAKAAPAPRVEVPITVVNQSSADVSVARKSGGRGGYEILMRDVEARMETNYGLRKVQKGRG